MAARTGTVSNVFNNLYTTLRRSYADYAAVYGGELMIVFANLFLNRQTRIPYYNKFESAYAKNTPDGYLPVDLSPYYFREVPVRFYTQQLNLFLGGTDPLTLKPVFQITPFINGKYSTVYINYDPSLMDARIKAFNAMVMDTNANDIAQLDIVIKENIHRLEVCWNQLQLLAQAYNAGRYTNKAFIETNAQIVTRDVNNLQNIDRTIVYKLCKECKDSARLSGYTPVLISSTGALSLEYIGSGLIDATALSNNIRFKNETGQQYAQMLNAIATEWKTTQGATNGETRLPTPNGADQNAFYYSPMNTVTVTANKPQASSNTSNQNSTGKILPYIALAAGAFLLMSNSKKHK